MTGADAGWATVGGVLIGGAAALLLAFDGHLAGVSGAVRGLVRPKSGDVDWRVGFVAGLVLGGAALSLLLPATFEVPATALWRLALAGLLVGVGTGVSHGCTSGHGVCGIGRGSPTSLAATGTFVAVGMVTVTAVRLLTGSP